MCQDVICTLQSAAFKETWLKMEGAGLNEVRVMRREKKRQAQRRSGEKRGNDMEQCGGRKRHPNALNDDILYTECTAE